MCEHLGIAEAHGIRKTDEHGQQKDKARGQGRGSIAGYAMDENANEQADTSE
jgi:hypothetical protein